MWLAHEKCHHHTRQTLTYQYLIPLQEHSKPPGDFLGRELNTLADLATGPGWNLTVCNVTRKVLSTVFETSGRA